MYVYIFIDRGGTLSVWDSANHRGYSTHAHRGSSLE